MKPDRRADLISPHAADHARSTRRMSDRIGGKPGTLRGLLRWATREYAGEPPVRLHRAAEDAGGGPALSGAAAAYLGFHQDAGANDWYKLAHALDADGSFRTPMRAAIERVGDSERRAFLRATLTNVLFPSDVAAQFSIPSWCAADVLYASLSALYDAWRDRPLPRRSWVDLSESQQVAESVVA